MKLRRILIFLAIIILLIDLAYFYPKLTGTGKVVYEIKIANVTKIIDGDTIETDIGTIRLLGINTPEKKQAYYEEAKEFLNKVLNKEVEIEIHGKDKYNRTLGYVYFNNQLINKEILQQGLANLYVYEEDSYFPELKKAEQEARQEEKGIWKKSENYGCVKIVNLKYIEEKRCKNQEQLVLNNKCEKMSLILKDEANHIYEISLEKGIFEKNFSCIFNDKEDALFLRDEDGLVGYYSYLDE